MDVWVDIFFYEKLQEIIMQTLNFWKYAETITTSKSLADVFNKFADENNISLFSRSYLWKAVNNDVESSFKRTAADSSKSVVQTAIKEVMKGLPGLLNSIDGGSSESSLEDITKSEPLVQEPIEKKLDPTTAINQEADKQDNQVASDIDAFNAQSTSETSKSEPMKPAEPKGISTIFDTLHN